ncbi:MAG: phage holin family protein [Candidatus Pacebacteria bacterium]|nr:phage holin family protein [Candidatus Paceibacterota bacterium]
MGLITKLLLTVLTLLLVSRYIPGIEVSGFYIALIVAVVLGLINLIIKPILVLLTLPINLLTLGLFTFVINAGLFWFVSTFVEGFTVDGFIPAFIGALSIVVVHWLAEKIVD